MNLAKTLAVSAVAGMLIGSAVGCGGGNGATPGAADPSAAGGKARAAPAAARRPRAAGSPRAARRAVARRPAALRHPRLRSTDSPGRRAALVRAAWRSHLKGLRREHRSCPEQADEGHDRWDIERGTRSRISASASACAARTSAHVLRERPAMDWFEIISENYFAEGGIARANLESVRAAYRLVPHGVSLSIGGTRPARPRLPPAPASASCGASTLPGAATICAGRAPAASTSTTCSRCPTRKHAGARGRAGEARPGRARGPLRARERVLVPGVPREHDGRARVSRRARRARRLRDPARREQRVRQRVTITGSTRTATSTRSPAIASCRCTSPGTPTRARISSTRTPTTCEREVWQLYRRAVAPLRGRGHAGRVGRGHPELGRARERSRGRALGA